jgi:hypothetical protein
VVIIAMIVWVQPVVGSIDRLPMVVTLFGPLAFLVLGWRDEIVYHRLRTAHREDIMHTTAHLAAGLMLASLYAMRFAG